MAPGGCWEHQGDQSVKYMLVYHYAVHLKLIQNNIEGKLQLKTNF